MTQITSEGWLEAPCFLSVNEEPPISMELHYMRFSFYDKVMTRHDYRYNSSSSHDAALELCQSFTLLLPVAEPSKICEIKRYCVLQYR